MNSIEWLNRISNAFSIWNSITFNAISIDLMVVNIGHSVFVCIGIKCDAHHLDYHKFENNLIKMCTSFIIPVLLIQNATDKITANRMNRF